MTNKSFTLQAIDQIKKNNQHTKHTEKPISLNALDKYFCQKFVQQSLVKTDSNIETLSIKIIYNKYLEACLIEKRQNALSINSLIQILSIQSIKTIIDNNDMYILGYTLNIQKQEAFRQQPDQFREYTVEEVIQAGWFSENNEQGIYRRIKFGSLKAKRISAKRVVILGSSIIEALTKSDENISV